MGLHQGTGHRHPERGAELVAAERLRASIEDLRLALRGEGRTGIPERQLASVRCGARGETSDRTRVAAGEDVRPGAGERELEPVEVHPDGGKARREGDLEANAPLARGGHGRLGARPERRQRVFVAEVQTEPRDVEPPGLGQKLPAVERPVHIAEHHLHGRPDPLVQGEARGSEQGRVRTHRSQGTPELVASQGQEPDGGVVWGAIHGGLARMSPADVHEPTDVVRNVYFLRGSRLLGAQSLRSGQRNGAMGGPSHRNRGVARRVLVVDDDPDILDALSEILEVEGYRVQRARNGREALQRLEQELPDLVLLDLMMPVMDGWEFARSLDPGARPPIIVLSADRNVSAKAKEIGALGWLAKPFELSELLAAVRSVVPVETP